MRKKAKKWFDVVRDGKNDAAIFALVLPALINLYYERGPTLNSADACVKPTAMTAIKCTLWGSLVSPDYATNFGQWREQFHVVIAGSNGYFKLPANACSAISSAYNGNGCSWPTERVDWMTYGSMSAATVKSTTAAVLKPTAAPAGFKTVASAGAKAAESYAVSYPS
jgi:hypothetical protein